MKFNFSSAFRIIIWLLTTLMTLINILSKNNLHAYQCLQILQANLSNKRDIAENLHWCLPLFLMFNYMRIKLNHILFVCFYLHLVLLLHTYVMIVECGWQPSFSLFRFCLFSRCFNASISPCVDVSLLWRYSLWNSVDATSH